MFVCTTVLCEYMNLPRNDVCNFFVDTHVRLKIYRELYHCIIYIANEGRHFRKLNIFAFVDCGKIINTWHDLLCFVLLYK